MAEVTLRRKVTLKRKETVAFTFSGKLKVQLLWNSPTDLDLCLFFKTKSGEEGGVFSDGFRNRKSDLGSDTSFPFILHKGDMPEPGDESGSIEKIFVYELTDIAEAYVCVLNYNAAVDGRDVTFSEEGGRVQLQSDSGDYLEVLADSTTPGAVYWVATILNRDGDFALREEGKVLDLGAAFDEIPGFKLICN